MQKLPRFEFHSKWNILWPINLLSTANQVSIKLLESFCHIISLFPDNDRQQVDFKW